MLYETKVFFPFPLQHQLSTVLVGRQVALLDKGGMQRKARLGKAFFYVSHSEEQIRSAICDGEYSLRVNLIYYPKAMKCNQDFRGFDKKDSVIFQTEAQPKTYGEESPRDWPDFSWYARPAVPTEFLY